VKNYPPSCNKCVTGKVVFREFAKPDLCQADCKAAGAAEITLYEKEMVCVEECGESYYKVETPKKICTKCSSDCAECTTNTVCTKCADEFFLTKAKTCIAACPEQ